MERTTAPVDTGMDMRDLLTDPDFPRRNRGSRPFTHHLEAVSRLAAVFAETPGLVLQELVEIAVHYCGADSSGISLEEETPSGEKRFRWVAIAGSFAQYVNATTPRFFSPCGTTLDADRAQLYRVTKPYYDYLGVTADEITDGLLIPWSNEYLRGTIWAVAHHSNEAFDMDDYRLLTTLAAFASMALRHQHQQRVLHDRERQAASAARANELAHAINNPLQGLVNTLYLARHDEANTQQYLAQAQQEVAELSELVDKLLNLSRSRRYDGLAAD